MKESLVSKDSNNEDKKHNDKRNKFSLLIKEQLYDIIQQNQIYNSIILMNRYIQSPRYFKFIFNVKRKSFNCLCYIRNLFTSKSTNNYKLLYGASSYNKSFINSSLIISVICLSLGISYIANRYKIYKSNSNQSIEKEISNLQKKNAELIESNKKLLTLINKKL